MHLLDQRPYLGHEQLVRRLPRPLPLHQRLPWCLTTRFCFYRRIVHIHGHACLTAWYNMYQVVRNSSDAVAGCVFRDAFLHCSIVRDRDLAVVSKPGSMLWNRHGIFVRRICRRHPTVVHCSTESGQYIPYNSWIAKLSDAVQHATDIEWCRRMELVLPVLVSEGWYILWPPMP